nr:hypothetical protein [Tanacetum cinerariifolium]
DLCEKYYIPDAVHPDFPGPNSRIRRSPTGAEIDLFAFIHHADPTKVKIGWREISKGEVPLLELTKDRVVSLDGVHDQEDVATPGVGSGDEDANKEAQALVANKPKKLKKRKTVDGTGSSGFPSKKLMVDHGTSGDASATTVEKFLTVLQDLLDKSTLAAKIGDTTAATIPLVTSFVAPIPEREVVEYVDSIFAANVQTRRPAERFVISSDTPVSNADVADDENVNEATHAGNFTDSTSEGNVDLDAARPSQPSRNDISFESFYVSLDMDSEALGQAYVPRWDVLNDYLLDDSNVCRSVVDQLTPPVFFSQLCAMEYDQLLNEFNVRAACQTCLSVEVRMLLEHLFRGKNRLEDRCEAEEAARAYELGSLKEQSVAFVSAAAAKDAKIATLYQDLSQLQLSCDYLSIKASTIECEKDKLIDQVSLLEVTCSELRGEVRRWIRSRDARLLVMKCLHSLEYMTALGGAIRCAIKKGMHDGLTTGIDHESQKDTSIIDIMDLLHLEGFAAETLEGLLLQPSSKQLMVPIHRLEDQNVIGEISLSDSLEVAYNRVQRLKGDATACHLSLTDTMVPLVEPLSVRILTGETMTSVV